MENILPNRISKLAWLVFCAVLTTFIFVLPVSAQEQSTLPADKASEYQSYLENGTEHLEQGRYRKAIAEFNRALLLDPASEKAKRGIIRANQKIAARSVAPDTASIEGDRLNFHLAKGTEYYDEEKFDDAAAEWEKVLQIDPDNRLAVSLIDAAKRAKIDLLIEKGHDQFFTGNYEEAIAIWKEAQELAPTSAVLMELLSDAQEVRHAQEMAKLREDIDLQVKTMGEFIQKESLLPDETSPDGMKYKDISMKPPVYKPKGFERREAILKELEQPVAFEFDCEPLRDVLAFLTTITGLNIVVDEDIYEEFGVLEDCFGNEVDREEIFVDIHVNDIPLQSALNAMFRQHGLGYSIERDFLYISTPDILRGSSFEQLETRFYHIRDTSRMIMPKLYTTGTAGEVDLGGGERLNLASGADLIKRVKEISGKDVLELDSDYSQYSVGRLVNILRNFVPIVLDPTKTEGEKKKKKINEDKVYGGHESETEDWDVFQLSRMRWMTSEDMEILSLIDYDAHTNTLIVRNTPTNLEIVEVFLDQLDREPRQISVEAKFLTYVIEEAEKVGIDWSSSPITRSISSLYDGAEIDFELETDVADTITEGAYGGRGGNILFRFRKEDGEELALAINLLKELKSTQTVSAPRLVTLSNKPAVIQNVLTRSFRSNLTITKTTTVTGDNIVIDTGIEQEFTDVSEGVTLSVTGQIQDDNTIRLFVLPDVADILGEPDEFEVITSDEGEEVINVIKRPQVVRQSLFTNVIVNDGDTLVLGGFMDAALTEQKSGVPFFKDIPFFGRFFENEANIKSTTNLLIFVTVNIMDTRGVSYTRLK